MLFGTLFVFASTLFGIYPAKVVGHGVDLIIETVKIGRLMDGFDSKASIEKILAFNAFLFLLFIIALALIKGVFTFLMRQTIIIASRLIEYDLKNEIFAHYQFLSLSFYRRNNTGDLMNRISEDVTRVRMYLGPAIMYTLNLVVLFALVIITMFNVNARLTLYVLFPLPFLSLSIYLVSDKMNRFSDSVQEQQSRLSTFVQEAFSGIRVLKSFVKEEQREKEFAHESEHYKNKSMELVKVNAMFFPLIMMLVGVSNIMVIWIGGQQVIAGTITMGNIAEFIIYVNLLTWPIASIGWVTSLVQRAAASQERINEFLRIQPDIRDESLALGQTVNRKPESVSGLVEFRDVSFVYPDSGVRALEHVSFIVEPGKSLAVLGKTGSGKSTLASLIVRMYDATGGKVLIDDKEIQTFPLAALRSNIGYVPQDVFLFSDSIANNIAFGVDENFYGLRSMVYASESTKVNGKSETINRKLSIEQAAKDAVIYDNIMEFPKGFDTMLGERGITLSGGQKQRVSIARAIIRNPKILLFDDCLSAVDTRTEEQILHNLFRVMKDRTSLIISHRVSTVKHADYIIVLDDGKIAEQGTHESLIGTKGLYLELYEKQLLEEEVKD